MTQDTSLLATIGILAGPTGSMLIGSFLVVWIRFPKFFQAMMQNLSAGILISAIGSELFPLLQNGVESADKAPSDKEFYFGSITGFVVGMGFMFAIDFVVEFFEDDDDDDDGDGGGELNIGDDSKSNEEGLLDRTVTNLNREIPNMVETLSSLMEKVESGADEDTLDRIAHRAMFTIDKARRTLTKKIPLSDAARDEMNGHVKEIVDMVVNLKQIESNCKARKELNRISNKMKHLHDDHTDLRFSRWKTHALLKPVKNVQTVLPYSTIFAVTVDAAVDGILIGLALSAEHAAGISMAIATVIEMGVRSLSLRTLLHILTHNTTHSFSASHFHHKSRQARTHHSNTQSFVSYHLSSFWEVELSDMRSETHCRTIKVYLSDS